MKKVGLFGGSFDPIHYGHVNLALELTEKCELDEVWFIPTQISPHKLHTTPIALEHRLALLHLALEDLPAFKVNDIEGRLPTPSYTINTLKALISETSAEPCQFYFLLGEDALPVFFRWYLPQEIVKLTPLLIGSRSGVWDYDFPDLDRSIKDAIQKGLVPTRLMDISSTEIRARLAKGLYCGHLVPTRALDYVDRHQLYIPQP